MHALCTLLELLLLPPLLLLLLLQEERQSIFSTHRVCSFNVQTLIFNKNWPHLFIMLISMWSRPFIIESKYCILKSSLVMSILIWDRLSERYRVYLCYDPWPVYAIYVECTTNVYVISISAQFHLSIRNKDLYTHDYISCFVATIVGNYVYVCVFFMHAHTQIQAHTLRTYIVQCSFY